MFKNLIKVEKLEKKTSRQHGDPDEAGERNVESPQSSSGSKKGVPVMKAQQGQTCWELTKV